MRSSGADLLARGRPPIVDDLDIGGGRRGGQPGVVAEQRMQPRADVESDLDGLLDDGSPARRQLAAWWSRAEQEGRRSTRQRLGQRADDGDVVAVAHHVAHVAAGAGRVEDGDDDVASIADDAHRGLGADLAELALGQDDQPLPCLGRGTHGPQSRHEDAPGARSGGVRDVQLVPHIGFEPMISALRGRCPGPLDECGEQHGRCGPWARESSMASRSGDPGHPSTGEFGATGDGRRGTRGWRRRPARRRPPR